MDDFQGKALIWILASIDARVYLGEVRQILQ